MIEDDKPILEIEEIEAKLGELRRTSPKMRLAALTRAGDAIIAEAQDLAPVRTGALRSSDVVRKKGRGIAIGFSVSYAAAVHETHPDQARFLALAIEEEGQRILGESVEQALEKVSKLKQAGRRGRRG